MNKNLKTISVKSQSQNPNSLLNTYKELLSIRRESEILRKGDIRLLEDPYENVLAYFRIYKKKKLLILLNFKNDESEFNLEKQTHPKT